ncbi:MAG: DUF5320 domain-containing protein [Bacteroidales bacterium]|nr:DUF5320 domain-containing protein [Bacteroidales bacterium]
MPGGDRTGPSGAGPMTGRHLGFCVGNDEPGGIYGRAYGSGRGPGMGFRRGPRGRFGRGYAWGSVPAPDYSTDTEDEKRFLEKEIDELKDQLAFLENKLTKIKD